MFLTTSYGGGSENGIRIVARPVSASIEAVKADFLKWLFGAPIAQGGLIVALVRLLWPGALSRGLRFRVMTG